MSYNPFLKIYVEHEYADFQLCPTLRLQPTKKTTHWLSQHKCISLYGPGCAKISMHMDAKVEKMVVLDFLGFSSDPYFPNYTLFEDEQSDSVPVFFFTTPKGNNVKTDYIWEDFSSWKSSLIVKPYFIIKVQILPHVSEEQKIAVRLLSKKVYVKYYIMGEFAEEQMQIIDISYSQEKILFNAVQEELPMKAQSFISDRPISLQKGCHSHFQLQEKNSSRVLLSKLPNVDTKSLAKSSISDGSSILIAETLVL